LADEEAGWEAAGFGAFALQEGFEHFDGGEAHAVFGLADCGEGDAEEIGGEHIAEADDGEVGGDAEALVQEGIGGSDGDEIIHGLDGGSVRVFV